MISNSADDLDRFDSILPFPLIYNSLVRQLPLDAIAWLEGALVKIADQLAADSSNTRTLFSTFSRVSRKLGKADLQVSTLDRQIADLICPGWHLDHWSIDQAARVLLLLVLPAAVQKPLVETLIGSADVYESGRDLSKSAAFAPS